MGRAAAAYVFQDLLFAVVLCVICGGATGLLYLAHPYILAQPSANGPCGRIFHYAETRGGMKLMARSASAVIVSDGLTPGLALTALPSMTYRPG